ncbi:hypothetical protein J3R30DRAFT_312310 [Lentinula aciculospora]|uniref:Uncharacterized protein n=1 Tax=Lentinula aciculospora TaxID=153920 RepID=A0A9W9AAP4_9AGAR|nr:hypothetical protein J3R30DRAFT_312310 [Lentinula aciculospora]
MDIKLPADGTEKQPPPQSRSYRTTLRSTTWDVSEHVLRTLTSAAQYAPTPYLGSLSVVALSIFNAVQGAKENQAVLDQLGKMACDLVFGVYKTHEELQQQSSPKSDNTASDKHSPFSTDPTLNRQVEELLGTLRNVQAWIETVKSRKYIHKVIASRSDLNTIQEFRDQLKAAMDKFQLQSIITLRSTVTRLATEQTRQHDIVREKLTTIHADVKQNLNRNPFTESPISSEPASPLSSPPRSPYRSSTFPTTNPFMPLVSRSATIQGNISVNNISGNYSVNSSIDNSTRDNFNNVFNGNSMVFNTGLRQGRVDERENNSHWI